MRKQKLYISAIVCFIVLIMSSAVSSEVLFTSGSWGVVSTKDEMTDKVYYYLTYINDEVQFSIVSLKGDSNVANEVWVFNKMSILKGRTVNMRVDDNPAESIYGEMTEMTTVAFQQQNSNILNQMKVGSILLVEVDSAYPPSVIDPITRVNLDGFIQAYYKYRKFVEE